MTTVICVFIITKKTMNKILFVEKCVFIRKLNCGEIRFLSENQPPISHKKNVCIIFERLSSRF